MKRFIMLLAGLLFSGLALAAININTATQQELEALNGIGPVKAQAIIDHRKANGPFKSIEQLKDVKGVGDATFDKIKGDVSVSGATTPAAKAAAPGAPTKAEAPKAAATAPAAPTKAEAPKAAAVAPAAPMKAEAPKAPVAAPAMSAKDEKAAKDKAAKDEKAAKDKAAADQKAKDMAAADAKKGDTAKK
jgi:competence protein ComEA